MKNNIHVHGTNYDIEVWNTGKTWESYGYINDTEIDSVWCDVHCETFDEMDEMILDIIRDELN